MKKLTSILLFFFIFSMNILAGDVRMLTMQDGLINNYTTAITQDFRGRIWIGTESGLSMFDGFRFRNFSKHSNSKSSNVLAGDAISCLYAYDKWLWVGTKSGLSRINLITLEVDTLKIPLLYNVVDICKGDGETLWFANHYSYIMKYNLKDDSRTLYTEKDIKGLKMDFRSITYAGKGILYLGHSNGGVSIVDLHRRCRVSNYLGNSNVYCIYVGKDQKAWIGSNTGLYIYDEKNNTMLNGPTTERVYDICRLRNGEIKYTLGNNRALMQDRVGNLWECIYGEGVRFTSRIQTPFNVISYYEQLPNSLRPHKVFCLLAEGPSVWMGTDGELVRKDLNGNTLYEVKTNNVQVQSLLRLDSSHLLVGCMDGGLLLLYEPSKSLSQVRGIGRFNDVNSIYRDSSGIIWISTDIGLYTYNNGCAVKDALYAKVHGEMPVSCVRSDSKGRLWIATIGDGVYLKDKHQITSVDIANKDSIKNVEYILADSKNGLWVAEAGALVHIPDVGNPKRFVVYTEDDGLADSYIHALAEDAVGNIWMSTNVGISCWNVKNQCFENYDNHLNVPNTNFNYLSVTKMDDGTIVFGSLLGACFFNTKNRGIQHAIEKVQILDTHILNNDPHCLHIEFGIPDYALNGFVEYQYKIDGMTDKWIGTGDENSVQLMGMAPGKYIFNVRARIKNGHWNDKQIASFEFYVPYPWYIRWWAILAYVVIVLCAIFVWFYLYRRRVYTLGLLEVDRQRFAVYEGITGELRQQIEHFRSEVEQLLKERSAFVKESASVEESDSDKSGGLSDIDQEFMDKIDTLIRDNLDEEKIDIAFFTDKMAMSTSTFYRKMKSVTGVSANEYVRKKRLEASTRLLLSGKHNISEVASMTGFSSLRYYRDLFKAEYGMTPSEYIEKNRK